MPSSSGVCSVLLEVSAVQIDLSQPVELQGPFDVIIHKITDLMVAADGGDEEASASVDRIEVC